MQRPPARLTAVMGVARALLSTLEPDEAVEVLVSEFGWDVTFQALAMMRGERVEVAFALSWQWLVTAPLERQLRQVPPAGGQAHA